MTAPRASMQTPENTWLLRPRPRLREKAAADEVWKLY